jgi:deoxyribose-phosphate aldolase
MSIAPDRAAILSAIDHTVLKPEAPASAIEQAAREAIEHGFASVCASPRYVPLLAELLDGEKPAVCTVIGFPNGTHASRVKAYETSVAVEQGAEEVDMVVFLPDLLELREQAVLDDIALVTQAAKLQNPNVIVKVIVESAALMAGAPPEVAEARLACACRAVKAAGADFIKTSTGFHPAGGASLEAVQLMAKHGRGLLIKASGGIRDLAAAKVYLEAGVTRLGTSAGVAIAQGLVSEAAY